MKCAPCFLDWMDQMETTDRVQTNSPIVHKGAPSSPLKCFCSVWKETTYPHETNFWEENWQLKEKLRRPHSSWNHLEADTVIFDDDWLNQKHLLLKDYRVTELASFGSCSLCRQGNQQALELPPPTPHVSHKAILTLLKCTLQFPWET